MTLIVRSLDHTGAEEVMKQGGCLAGIFDYQGDVADRFEHGPPR
jgi:hypothetical protein